MSAKCKCGGDATWFVVGPKNELEKLVCDDCNNVIDQRKHISDEELRKRFLKLEKDFESKRAIDYGRIEEGVRVIGGYRSRDL